MSSVLAIMKCYRPQRKVLPRTWPSTGQEGLIVCPTAKEGAGGENLKVEKKWVPDTTLLKHTYPSPLQYHKKKKITSMKYSYPPQWHILFKKLKKKKKKLKIPNYEKAPLKN